MDFFQSIKLARIQRAGLVPDVVSGDVTTAQYIMACCKLAIEAKVLIGSD